MPYKEEGTHFRSITRQVLFSGEGDLPVEWRYFEVGGGGHSTLERHEHQHAVIVIRGSGRVMVGESVEDIAMHDIVHIPPMTWHQFRAVHGEALGFLCIVNHDRDRPQRPNEADVAGLIASQEIADFIRI